MAQLRKWAIDLNREFLKVFHILGQRGDANLYYLLLVLVRFHPRSRQQLTTDAGEDAGKGEASPAVGRTESWYSLGENQGGEFSKS